VQLDDLPTSMKLLGDAGYGQGATPPEQAGPASESGGLDETKAPAVKSRKAEDLSLAELERRHILETLEKLKGNRTHTARHLGISRRTLQRKLRELGLE